MGHILDCKEQYYFVHEQCFFLNLKAWKLSGSPEYYSDNLDVTGNAVSTDTQFTIPGGWSIIGYLSENSMLPQTAMTDGWVQISSENLVILKDEVGNVYWPEFGLNNIGYMQAGEGYQIKTNATASFSFTYNDNGRFA